MPKFYIFNHLYLNMAKCSNTKLIVLFCFFLLFMIPILMQAQSQYVTPDGEGDITFTPGLRIQTRYEYNQKDKNNDIFIRRFRLKGSGKVFNLANYYFELKVDNAGRFNNSPKAQVENAWLNFPFLKDLSVRVGFYDMVFSRNALTSDSKLLLMNRSLIKGALTVLGLADNTVGVLVHGRPFGGHMTYGFGIFDNVGFEVPGLDSTVSLRKSDGAMTSGRLGVDLLDPAPAGGYADYRSSYIGEGQRLSIAINAAYLSKAEIGNKVFALYAWGADLFFNTGPVTVEAEYDSYIEDVSAGSSPDLDGSGWYAQAGYLFYVPFEFAVRYQELDPDNNVTGDKLKWTSVGLNIYIRGHNLKIQTEYLFKAEEGTEIDNDLFQLQLHEAGQK